MSEPPHLLHFRVSHYNEKVRWALDFKRLPYRTTNLMPGPHLGVMRKLTGQTKTPVISLDGRYVCGSAAIIKALEREVGGEIRSK